MKQTARGAAAALALMLCGVLACAPVCAASTLPPVSETIYEGVDVSVYQGDIDFASVKADGIEVAYIRAGYGSSYTDPWFEANWEKADAAKLKVGFYYYVTAESEAEARAQAARFADLISDKAYTARPAMDFESLDGLTADEVNVIGLAFLEELKAKTGVTPLVYTNDYRARTLWRSAFAAYPVWIADYDDAENPPAGGVWSAWTGFQYTDAGRVSGIEDRVDRDRFTSGVLLASCETPAVAAKGDQARHTVAAGDTLETLSRAYGVSAAALTARNGIAEPGAAARGGHGGAAGMQGSLSGPAQGGAGSAAGGISSVSQASTGALGAQNGFVPGQLLCIPSAHQGYALHIAARGETLAQLGVRYRLSASALASANNLPANGQLQSGQSILLPLL